MCTSCIDWKFSCALEETHSMLTLSPDSEYFMAEEAEKTDPRVWLPQGRSSWSGQSGHSLTTFGGGGGGGGGGGEEKQNQ